MFLFTSELSLVFIAATHKGTTRLSWPGLLTDWLLTVYPPMVTHLSTKRAQRRATSLMRQTKLPTSTNDLIDERSWFSFQVKYSQDFTFTKPIRRTYWTRTNDKPDWTTSLLVATLNADQKKKMKVITTRHIPKDNSSQLLCRSNSGQTERQLRTDSLYEWIWPLQDATDCRKRVDRTSSPARLPACDNNPDSPCNRIFRKLCDSASAWRVFTRESSYCFQRVLAIAILSVCLSVCHTGRSVKSDAS